MNIFVNTFPNAKSKQCVAEKLSWIE